MTKITAKNIIEKIGAKAIADCLGVGLHSVRHAKFTGEFPANWFDALDRLCKSEGIDCPRCLFTFRPSLGGVAKKHGNAKANIQPRAAKASGEVSA